MGDLPFDPEEFARAFARRQALGNAPPCPAWKDGQHCYVVRQEFTAAGPSDVVGMPTMQSAPVKACQCGAIVRLA